MTEGTLRRPFAVEDGYRIVGRLFGVRADEAEVEVTRERFRATFGRWTVDTPLANVADATVTGPHSVPKTIGPAHVSLADRGLTFATTSGRAACVSFLEPVRGLDPIGILRHPGLTVTVDDPESFVGELRRRAAEARAEAVADATLSQPDEDRLRAMTASELRSLADEHGVPYQRRASKADLLILLEAAIRRDLAPVPPTPER